MATLKDYYNANVNASVFIDETTEREAQTFTTSIEYSITSIVLLLYRVSIPGTITVEIQETTADKPNGTVRASGTTDGDTLPETYQTAEYREITFDTPYTLSASTKYAIVIKASNANPYPDREVYWRGDYSDPQYSGGSRVSSVDSGSNWTIDTDRDLVFLCYGIASAPGAPTNPSPGDTATGITLDESPLSWDASDPAADTYEIYFREQGEDWDLIGVAQAGVEYVLDFGYIDYEKTYEWRVNATNEGGTTTGTTWSFDSIVFDPILPGASGGAGGGGGGGGEGEESSPTGENNMITLRRLVVAVENKIWYEDI